MPKRPKDLLTALLKRFLEAIALILVLETASAQLAAPSSTIAPSMAPATRRGATEAAARGSA